MEQDVFLSANQEIVKKYNKKYPGVQFMTLAERTGEDKVEIVQVKEVDSPVPADNEEDDAELSRHEQLKN